MESKLKINSLTSLQALAGAGTHVSSCIYQKGLCDS
jgi:hypothetical protein